MRAIMNERLEFAVNGTNGEIEVHKNPSRAEFMRLIRKYRILHGQLDMSDFYVWDAYTGTHNDVRRYIGDGERLAMTDELLLLYEDDDVDLTQFTDNPNIQRAFGFKPRIASYLDHPALHIQKEAAS